MHLPLLLPQAYLDYVLRVGFFLLLGLLRYHLAHRDVQVLAIYVGVYLLAQRGHARAAALLDVGGKLESGQPFTAADALHGLAVLHYLLEFLYAIVLLLQDLTSALHFLEG